MPVQGKCPPVTNQTISVPHFHFLSINVACPSCGAELSEPPLIPRAAQFVNHSVLN